MVVVNSNSNNAQQQPVLVKLDSGGWVTFWASEPTGDGESPGVTYDLRGQVFDANGAAVGTEFIVPGTENTELRAANTGTGLDDWVDNKYYQRNDEADTVYSGAFDVIQLDGVNAGKFVAVFPWNRYNGANSIIRARIFEVDTTNGTSATLVKAIDNISSMNDANSRPYHYDPTLAASSDGGFILTLTESNYAQTANVGMGSLRTVDQYFNVKGSRYNSNDAGDQGSKIIDAYPTTVVLQQNHIFSSDVIVTAGYRDGQVRYSSYDGKDEHTIHGLSAFSYGGENQEPTDLIVLNENTIVGASQGNVDHSPGQIDVIRVSNQADRYWIETINSFELPQGAFQVDVVANDDGGFHAVWTIDHTEGNGAKNAEGAPANELHDRDHVINNDKTVQFAEFDKLGNISWEGIRNLTTNEYINQPKLVFTDDGKLNVTYQFMNGDSNSDIGMISDIYTNSEPTGGGKVLMWSLPDLGLGDDISLNIGETFTGKVATGTALIYDDDTTLSDSAGEYIESSSQKIIASTTSRLPLGHVNAIKGYTIQNTDTGEEFKISILGGYRETGTDQNYDPTLGNMNAYEYYVISEQPLKLSANYEVKAEVSPSDFDYNSNSFDQTGDIAYANLKSDIMIYENEDFDSRLFSTYKGLQHRDWRYDEFNNTSTEFVKGGDTRNLMISGDDYLGVSATNPVQPKVGDGVLNQEIYKDYVFAKGEEKIFLSFDFIRFDNWNNEKFAVFMDGQKIIEHMPVIDDPGASDQPFSFTTDGVTYSGTYSITLKEQGNIAGNVNGAGWNKDDQIFGVAIELNDPPINLRLGIGTDLDSTLAAAETYGIDDVLVANAFVCFARGTLIKTPAGEVRVEDLTVGDDVLTLDSGTQKIRWIGSTQRDSIDLAANPKLRPVRIRAGALGEGLPAQDLLVSRQHRFLVRSPIAQRMFDSSEVLLPAIKLIDLEGIDIAQDVEAVEYFHILFDRHEIVCSNGAWSESLFTGPEALQAVPPASAQEIKKLFPEICEPDYEPASVRHIPETGKLMRKLVARHKKNNKPLYTIH